MTENELAKLIKEAADAHHIYEKEVLKGQYDKDWHKWYAKWIQKNQKKK